MRWNQDRNEISVGRIPAGTRLPLAPAAGFSLAAVLLVTLLAAGPALAQLGTIQGKVVDRVSQQPIFAANVLVSSLRDPAFTHTRGTDEQGSFAVADLAPGMYEVQVSYIGHEQVTRVVEVTAGGTTTLSIPLAIAAIQLNPIIITASRREEKTLDAPAVSQTIDADVIESKTVLTIADHLTAREGVDVAHHGLNTGTVAVRGFNNILTQATHLMVDNRNAEVPLARFKAFPFIQSLNEDIERIEVVSGPGSALYGPNVANGIVHLITRSPFDHPGSLVYAAGGNRDLRVLAGRHAAAPNEHFGYKLTAQYFEGTEFEYHDPVEIRAREAAIAAGADPDSLLVGVRDFDIRRWTVEGRADWKPNDDVLLIANGGAAEVDEIDLGPVGAVQDKNWRQTYGQVRLRHKKLFLQGYMNSNVGEGYALTNGIPLEVDNQFIATQAQHSASVGEQHDFIYGLDAQFTRGDTKGSLSGRNESDDNIDEVGGYLQWEWGFHPRWEALAALRADHHNRLENLVFSPRAALTFEPMPGHKVRSTYNRAYTTPGYPDLFLDALAVSDLGGLEAATGKSGYDLWLKGVPKGGYTFRRDAVNGGTDGLFMQVPAALGGTDDYVPAEATRMWPVIQGMLVAQGIDIRAIPAPSSSEVSTGLRRLNLGTASFDPIDPSEVRDIPTLESMITNTFEVGYKGIVGARTAITCSAYYSRFENFLGPARVETPNVFFDQTTLRAYLANPAFGLSAAEIQQFSAVIASIPLGTVTESDALDPAALLMTSRNFGSIDLWGVDFSWDFFARRNLTLGATYSWVSDDFFKNVDGVDNIALNAPKNKVGLRLRFDDEASGLGADVRYRWIDAFPVQSGVFVGAVDSYHVLDLGAEYRFGFSAGTAIALTVTNLFDRPHREYVGTPILRRVGLLRLSQKF